MSERQFTASRFEDLAALAYPDADTDGLVPCNDFHLYLFVVDDLADADEQFGKNLERLRFYFEQHVRWLRQGGWRLMTPQAPCCSMFDLACWSAPLHAGSCASRTASTTTSRAA